MLSLDWNYIDMHLHLVILWVFIGFVSNYLVLSKVKAYYNLHEPTNNEIISCLVLALVWPYLLFLAFHE